MKCYDIYDKYLLSPTQSSGYNFAMAVVELDSKLKEVPDGIPNLPDLKAYGEGSFEHFKEMVVAGYCSE